METEQFLFNNGLLDEGSFYELTPEALSVVNEYVEVTRHLQEIHQLFSLFMYNVECMICTYTLENNGNITINGQPANSEKDFIAINAITNSILASGKTLNESMNCFIKEHFDETENPRIQFEVFCREAYDSSFAYRLLSRLRDYTQHGHLAVSKENSCYFFNLKTILHKPHYTHNATLAQQIKEISEDIIQNYQDTPTIYILFAIAEFISQFLNIYNCFWESVIDETVDFCDYFIQFVSQMPENFIYKEKISEGPFIYDVVDGIAQIVLVDSNAKQMYMKFADEASAISLEYENSWIVLANSVVRIKKENGNVVSISVPSI